MRAGLDLSVQVSHQVGRDHFFLERGLGCTFLDVSSLWEWKGGPGVSAAWRWILTGVGGWGQ